MSERHLPFSSDYRVQSDDDQGLLAPTERRLLAEEVVDRLRNAILAGQLAPAQRISEDHLARMLRVSRGPVREALTRLEQEGLVIKLRNRATTVTRLTPEDAEEVYTLRLALERLAVTRAIRYAQPDEIQALQDIVNTMNEALAAGVSPQVAAHLDVQFHEVLFSASHHKRLLEAWRNLKSQIRILLLYRNLANIDFRSHLIDSHQKIVDAVKEKDEPRALSLIEDHNWGSYTRVIQGQANFDQAGTTG